MGNKVVGGQKPVVSALKRGMSLASRLRTLAMAAACCLVAGGAWATEYSYDENTSVTTFNVDEDSTLTGGKTLTVTSSFTGTSDSTLTISNNSTLRLQYESTSWATSLPAVQIDSGSTLQIDSKTLYYHAPIHGSGTFYLYSMYSGQNPTINPTNSTFSGTLSIYHRQAGNVQIGRSSGPAGDYFPNRPLLLIDNYNNSYSGPLYIGGHIATYPLKLRGLKSYNYQKKANKISADCDQDVAGTRFLDIELDDDYAFYGYFSDSDASKPQVGLIVGTQEDTHHTLTLLNENTTTYGDLIITNGASVYLNGGVWPNGPVTLHAYSKLVLNGAKSFSSLTMKNGSVLTLSSASAGATVSTMEVGEGNIAIVKLTDSSGVATAVEEGTALISWTTAPTGGSFIFDDSDLNSSYELEIGETGLVIKARTESIAIGNWTGAGADNNWDNPKNWENGIIPGSSDDVVFGENAEGWSVALDGDRTVASATFDSDILVSGGALFSSRYDGDGTITLSGNSGLGNNGTEISITNDIVIASSDSCTNVLYAKSKSLTIEGAINGAGNLELVADADQIGVLLRGNNNMTSGSVIIRATTNSGSGRRNLSKVNPMATSSKLTWQASTSDSSKNGDKWAFCLDSNANYYFGSVGDSVINNKYGLTGMVWEIGELGKNDKLAGYLTNADNKSNTIRKVGAGTLTMTMGYVYNYDVASGTLELASDTSKPYTSGQIKFSGNGVLKLNSAYTHDVSTNIAKVVSSCDVIVDDGGVDRTFEVAIPGSAGFVKKGSGTLTLSVAPTYTGSTTVKEGVLLVPTGTTLTLSSGTKQDGTVEVDTVTYDKYVPYNVASVTVSETTYNFSSVAEAASFAKTNGNATVVITAELASTETIYIAAGEAFSLTVSDPNNYLTDGKTIAVVAADGTTVEAEEGTYSYTCPKEWTQNNTLTGTTTISESYFSTSDLYVPKNSNSAIGTLSVTGSGTKFNVDGAVNVAYANYSIGEIDIKDNAEMSMTGVMRVGNNAGTGTVHVVSGKLSVGNNFYVADGNSSGTVIVSGGTVDVAGEGRIAPGGNGVGELTIASGTVNFNSTSANTSVGYGANSNGRLNVYGGTLKVPSKDLVISANNTGSRGFFDFASGTVTLGAALKMGGKDGSVTSRGYASGIISNTVEVSAKQLKIGNAKYSDAELTIAGGETTSTSSIDIGANLCSSGLIEMTGGTLKTESAMNVGYAETSYGYFKMSGGTLTLTGSSSGFQVGNGTSATGVVEVVGGTVTIPNNSNAYFNVPNDSATGTEAAPLCGKVIVGGTGSVTVKHMNIGAQKYSDAYLTVAGGTLTVETKLRVGGKYQDGELDATAVGTYLQTDGAVTAAAFGIGCGGATGTATLSGGTLTVPAITKGTGTATLNLNGGTLKASADSNDFIADGITLNIQEGGIVIDTNGKSVTITQAINTEYPIVKKGTGTLTFSNGDNIDVDNITVEAGGVIVTKTAKTIYLGEFSFTGDKTFVNETVDYVGADVTYTGGFFLSNASDQRSTVGITNSTIRALRCNLADDSATANSVNRLNIWKGGKLITTGVPGTDTNAEKFYVGYRGVDNILNIVGGEVTTAAEMNLNSTATYALTVSEGGIVTVGSLTGNLPAYFDGGILAPYAASDAFASAPIVVGTNGLIVSNDVAITMSSAISGTGGLTKKGSGVLALTTAPTFTGAITVESGDGGVVIAVEDFDEDSKTFTLGSTTKKDDTYTGTGVKYIYGVTATISDVAFDYYASYTNADVKATVSEIGTYTLTVDGKNYVVDAAAAGEITFTNVDVGTAALGSSVAWSITASGTASGSADGSATVGTAVDGTAWMLENSTSRVGSWTDKDGNTETLTYTDGAASLSGKNTYHSAGVSTGEVVTVTTKVSFGDIADEDAVISADAQAAIKIASVNSVNTFQVLTNAAANAWNNVSNTSLGAPDPAETNTVVLTLNYMNQTYSVKVVKNEADYPLSDETSATSFPLASGASSLSQLEYTGSFDFVSLAGSYVSIGYTADVNAGEAGVAATNVIVSTDFVTNYMANVKASKVASELVTPRTGTGNGLTYFASYALGLNPDDETDKPLVDVQTDADGNFVVTLKDKDGNTLDVANNVAVTLTMKSGTSPDALNTTTEATSGSGESASFTIAPNTVDSVKYYKVQVNIGAK